jgi:hypothetical protein
MKDTTFDKSGMAAPGQPIPAGVKVYRQNPGRLNSPNAPGGEVHRSAIVERGGDLIKPSHADLSRGVK